MKRPARKQTQRTRQAAKELQPHLVWEAILENAGHGTATRAALMFIKQVPAQAYRDARRRIDTETSIGPLLDPSAYQTGERFDNAQKYCQVLDHLAAIAQAIEGAREE